MEEQTSDPRLWKKSGWTARVIKNENDEGWAVEMTRDGDPEPVLVSPWTMGRDKVNPKPMGHADFASLVKGANDVLIRHQAALRAKLHRSLVCTGIAGERWEAELDIQLDEDDPHAILNVTDTLTGELVRSGRAHPAFKLSEASIRTFVRTGEAG